jgi:hypothetical protein
MLEVRIEELEKQAREDFRYNESLMARSIPFLRKEAAEKIAKKEATEKEDDDEEYHQAWPSGSSDDDGPTTPLDFRESSIGSSVPFASTFCIRTRTIYSSTSKTSSWMNCRCPTWSNRIASLIGCSKQQYITREDHELDV